MVVVSVSESVSEVGGVGVGVISSSVIGGLTGVVTSQLTKQIPSNNKEIISLKLLEVMCSNFMFV